MDDKKHINHTKKTLMILNMWNFKTFKIQRIFQYCFKLNFKDSKVQITMYTWHIMYMMY
jgi:hypothetical protein